jgi:hypothetical protein
MNEKIKIFCKLYSVGFCFAQVYILLFPMFMLAYSSGTYECMLRINLYGEATLEIIIWIISFPIISYGFFLNVKDILTSRGNI